MEDGTTTALVASAYKPSGEVMWYLVGNGAYVKAVNPLGLTSLHIAVLFGERDYINGQLMLTKAAVNIPNNKGDTILLNRELYANFKNFSPGQAQLMKEALLALIAYCSPQLTSAKEGDWLTASEMAFEHWCLDAVTAIYTLTKHPPPPIRFEVFMRINEGKVYKMFTEFIPFIN